MYVVTQIENLIEEILHRIREKKEHEWCPILSSRCREVEAFHCNRTVAWLLHHYQRQLLVPSPNDELSLVFPRTTAKNTGNTIDHAYSLWWMRRRSGTMLFSFSWSERYVKAFGNSHPGRRLRTLYTIVYDRAQPNTFRITVVFLRNTWLSITIVILRVVYGRSCLYPIHYWESNSSFWIVYDRFMTNCTAIVCSRCLKQSFLLVSGNGRISPYTTRRNTIVILSQVLRENTATYGHGGRIWQYTVVNESGHSTWVAT